MKKRKTINQEEFNRMATSIILMFMEFTDIKPELRQEKLKSFSEWLTKKQTTNNAESVQLGQDDQTSEKFI